MGHTLNGLVFITGTLYPYVACSVINGNIAVKEIINLNVAGMSIFHTHNYLIIIMMYNVSIYLLSNIPACSPLHFIICAYIYSASFA